MLENFLDKAKQISELYKDIESSQKTLHYLSVHKWFSVSAGSSASYIINDPSVVEVTIKAYRELLDQKVDKLNELINGEYNKVMSNLSAIVNEEK